MRKRAVNLLVAATVMGQGVAITTSAKAAFILKYEEVGTDVVGKGSGFLDVTGLTFFGSTSGLCTNIGPAEAVACVGPDLSPLIDTYRGSIGGPSNFGPGLVSPRFSSGSGDLVALSLLFDDIDEPAGSVSTSFLSGDITFANSSFQSIGMTPGTYVWSWGSGMHADTFTVQVGVPEPSSWALLLAGFGALGLVGYRRTRKAEALG